MTKKMHGGSNRLGALRDRNANAIGRSRAIRNARTAKRERKTANRQQRNRERQNVLNRRNATRRNRAQRNADGKTAIQRRSDETAQRLNEYIGYCSELKERYTQKHGEVEEATGRLREIRDSLDRLTDDILENIRGIQDLNNVSNNNNKSPVNDYLGDGGNDNLDSLLAVLEGLLRQIPDDGAIRADRDRLKRMVDEQKAMQDNRNQNHQEINKKLDRIRQRLADIRNLGEQGADSKPRRPRGPGDGGEGGRRLPTGEGARRNNAAPARRNNAAPARRNNAAPARRNNAANLPNAPTLAPMPNAPTNTPVVRNEAEPVAVQLVRASPKSPKAINAQRKLEIARADNMENTMRRKGGRMNRTEKKRSKSSRRT